MNCPYCDETINALAKFCPKCGLPLKDDATVMGAYVSDSDGPNWSIIGVGAAAILVIALAIGWFSRPQSPSETVRREQIPQFGPGAQPGFRNSAPLYGGNQSQFRSSTPSMTNTRPRWAYTPPSRPAPTNGPMFFGEAGPAAPRHVSLLAPVIHRRPPVVQMARSNEPLPPAVPAGELALLAQMQGTAPIDESGYELTPDLALNNQIVRVEADGVWIYDPVQERWALRPDAKRRRPATRNQPAPEQFNPTLPEPPGVDIVPQPQ